MPSSAFSSRARPRFRGRRLEKNLQQIVEKAPPERGRNDALMIAGDEAPALGFVELLQHRRERHAGALFEQREREAVAQAQRIHHELEADLVPADVVLLLYRTARRRALHVVLGLPVANLAGNALRKRELAVRAGADRS